ncbi:type VII secretion target [Lentzea albidocapillata]|uniref:Excreted virulence factor EspC, type VII ESX diderm n=1 Tax=Lentzea albidocapillata TaxID=40571 RepID=A0A1W2FQV1_9PSEU|nr:type VII secretion target [Lentzea albidocapillata]SMD23978.1 Excreted virulence factor EspC, type VII ESX diderm [Lentzea albidocapillata]
MSEEVVTSGKVAGSAWDSIFGGGLSAVMDAGRAVAAAVETQQLSVDPQLVDAMIKKLTEMSDALENVAMNAGDLSMDTKLGGGYAEAISQGNRTFGQAAQKTLVDMAKAIESLKTQIEKSRASYKAVDQSSADALKKLDGK